MEANRYARPWVSKFIGEELGQRSGAGSAGFEKKRIFRYLLKKWKILRRPTGKEYAQFVGTNIHWRWGRYICVDLRSDRGGSEPRDELSSLLTRG